MEEREPSQLGKVRDAFVAGATLSPFFPSVQHRRALAFMGHVLWSRCNIGAVVAPQGGGKTLLMRRFVEELDERVLLAEVQRTDLDCRALLSEVLRQFGLTVTDAGVDVKGLLRILETFLQHQTAHGRFCLLLMEDAQRMHPSCLDGLIQLARIECKSRRVVKILMIGNPSLQHVVKSPRMREACAEMPVFEIDPLSEDQTGEYLAHRLRAVGLEHPDQLISPQIAAALHGCSNGVPGLINRLCMAAVDKAQAAGCRRLTLDSVYAAAQELGWTAAGDEFALSEPRAALRAILRLSEQSKPDREIELESRRLLIGRGPAADVVIDSMLVSRHHALLVREPGRDVLIDLGSTNGLSVNAAQVAKHVLRHRDLIQIGPARLVYLNPADARPAGEDSSETQQLPLPVFAADDGTDSGASLLPFGRVSGA